MIDPIWLFIEISLQAISVWPGVAAETGFIGNSKFRSKWQMTQSLVAQPTNPWIFQTTIPNRNVI